MIRTRSMIALAVLGALVMVALILPATIPANADDDNHSGHHHGDHHKHGGHDLLSLGSGGKLTVKLLQRGESETLAEIYASENTGKKVERAMRRGLIVHCYPGGNDTVSFTCEGATPPPETTTPETTAPETTAPETTVPATTP
jgi:hypothetical protein